MFFCILEEKRKNVVKIMRNFGDHSHFGLWLLKYLGCIVLT